MYDMSLLYLPAKGHHSSAVNTKVLTGHSSRKSTGLKARAKILFMFRSRSHRRCCGWTVGHWNANQGFAAGCSGAQKRQKRGIEGTPRWLFRLRGPDLLCANPHDPFALASRHGQVWRCSMSKKILEIKRFCLGDARGGYSTEWE